MQSPLERVGAVLRQQKHKRGKYDMGNKNIILVSSYYNSISIPSSGGMYSIIRFPSLFLPVFLHEISTCPRAGARLLTGMDIPATRLPYIPNSLFIYLRNPNLIPIGNGFGFLVFIKDIEV